MTTTYTTLWPDLAKQFVDLSPRIKTPSSSRTYLLQLRCLGQMFPGKRVGSFNKYDLAAFCTRGDEPSDATISGRKAVISSFFGWCKYREYIEVNPALDLKYEVKVGHEPQRENLWLTKTQFQTLLRVMPKDDSFQRRDRALVHTGMLTGVRLAGLVGMTWSAMDPDMTKIRLTAKGRKLMQVGVARQLRNILGEWREELRPSQGNDGPLFPCFHSGMARGVFEITCQPDKALGAEGARQAVKRAGRLIDVELNPHDMRRSFAGYLETIGTSLPNISRALGHKNIATTSRYLESNPNRTVAIAGGIEDIEFDL